jgi:hypothetical protein
MNGVPAITFRFRSTAPMPRVERTLLLPATSNPAIADAGAHRNLSCPIALYRASAGARSIPTAHIAGMGRPHRYRWTYRRVQLP